MYSIHSTQNDNHLLGLGYWKDDINITTSKRTTTCDKNYSSFQTNYLWYMVS